MQIKLNSRLGSIALAISAVLRNDKLDQMAKAAALHLVYHSAGSKAFGEKAGHERSESYSDALAAHVAKVAKEVLGALFEGVEIATSPYVKESRIDKLAKQMREIGMSEADIEAMVAKAKAAEVKTEVVEESDEEAVG